MFVDRIDVYKLDQRILRKVYGVEILNKNSIQLYIVFFDLVLCLGKNRSKYWVYFLSNEVK